MKLKVGDNVFFVPREKYNGQPRFCEITKIGRKWAEFDRGRRFDINTLEVDGGGYQSPGRIYLTKEEYDNKVKTQLLWIKLKELTSLYCCPDYLSTEDLQDAIDALQRNKK